MSCAFGASLSYPVQTRMHKYLVVVAIVTILNLNKLHGNIVLFSCFIEIPIKYGSILAQIFLIALLPINLKRGLYALRQSTISI